MDQYEIETLIKNIDDRTSRIEQILPTVATKEDLNAFATKEDLNAFATKEDMREEGERTRRHFDVVADGLKEGIKVIADGHKGLDDRITSLGRDIKSVLANHEHRITVLEADSSKRR
jgi:uncharacterized protein YicC (UPF0701 family)